MSNVPHDASHINSYQQQSNNLGESTNHQLTDNNTSINTPQSVSLLPSIHSSNEFTPRRNSIFGTQSQIPTYNNNNQSSDVLAPLNSIPSVSPHSSTSHPAKAINTQTPPVSSNLSPQGQNKARSLFGSPGQQNQPPPNRFQRAHTFTNGSVKQPAPGSLFRTQSSTDIHSGVKRKYPSLFGDSSAVRTRPQPAITENRLPTLVNSAAFMSNIYPSLSKTDAKLVTDLQNFLTQRLNNLRNQSSSFEQQYHQANFQLQQLRKQILGSSTDMKSLDSNDNLKMQSISRTVQILGLKKKFTLNNLGSTILHLNKIYEGSVSNYAEYCPNVRILCDRADALLQGAIENLALSITTNKAPVNSGVSRSLSTSSIRAKSLFSQEQSEQSPPVFQPLDKEKIEKLLDNIQNDTGGKSDLCETPGNLKVTLLEHQKMGLTWLLKMENSVKGGILADDMGLGKTIQTLALLLTHRSKNENQKTTLIVTPVSLLKQWEREIKTRVKSDSELKVYLYHGTGRKFGSFNEFREYDVVITTYGLLSREYKDHFGTSNDGSESSPFFQTDSIWYRVVLDEAQYIKNKSTLTSKACSSLKSEYRWCLTGTPMQNSVFDLYSLLRFLKIKPYDNETAFNLEIGNPIQRFADRRALRKLQVLLKAILLRRTKTSKIDGQPILQLPPRTITVESVILDNDELEFYNSLEKSAKTQMNQFISQGTISRNYSSILVLLLRLRQACCHPKLIERAQRLKANKSNAARSNKAAIALCRKLDVNLVKNVTQEANHTCSVCMDASDPVNLVLFYPCGHFICTECCEEFFDSTNISDGEVNEGTRKCPVCKCSVSEKELIDYSVFDLVYTGKLSDNEIMSNRNRSSSQIIKTRPSSSNLSELGSDISRPRFKLGSNNVDTKQVLEQQLTLQPENTIQPANKYYSSSNFKSSPNLTSLYDFSDLFPSGWISSSKINKCLELLKEIRTSYPGEKVIVFSQFTSLLDFLEIALQNLPSEQHTDYLRYDGSMSANNRHQCIINFFDMPSVSVLLLSLKAGNVGLTLTCASHIILMDPFWNPFVEDQAMDRAHRIGQIRPVYVHRLVVEGSVENRILELQQKKREVIEGALDESGLEKIGKLNQQELKFLFGLN